MKSPIRPQLLCEERSEPVTASTRDRVDCVPWPRLCVAMRRTVTSTIRIEREVPTHGHAKPWPWHTNKTSTQDRWMTASPLQSSADRVPSRRPFAEASDVASRSPLHRASACRRRRGVLLSARARSRLRLQDRRGQPRQPARLPGFESRLLLRDRQRPHRHASAQRLRPGGREAEPDAAAVRRHRRRPDRRRRHRQVHLGRVERVRLARRQAHDAVLLPRRQPRPQAGSGATGLGRKARQKPLSLRLPQHALPDAVHRGPSRQDR